MRMLRGYSRAIYYPTPMLSRIDAWPLFSIFRRVRRWTDWPRRGEPL